MTQNRVQQQSWGRPNAEKVDSCSTCVSLGVWGYVLNTCASLWAITKNTLRQCKFPGILILNQVSDRDEMHKQNIYKQQENTENTEIMQETRKWQGLSGRTLWLQANFKLACLKEGKHSTFLISQTPILKTSHHQILNVTVNSYACALITEPDRWYNIWTDKV